MINNNENRLRVAEILISNQQCKAHLVDLITKLWAHHNREDFDNVVEFLKENKLLNDKKK